ncbi:hypothetical protein [Roseicella frigidaeris]|uniref:Uncharacterized protein n=1 Tax=Roseicella frigidaeris TaxID=2230885 RepID=A0A327MFC6_9PROT|nr:hypothetical protein [Roseicella frigidaeris]RAI60774.1 hypothetical protein DOO78_01195 [Roseicella frigidaeris]
MALSLILHDLAALESEDETRFFEAIFQIAPEHWRLSAGATLLETGVSPSYLRDHLLRALPEPLRSMTQLLVTRVSADAAWNGLPTVGEQWLKDALAP